MGRDPRQRSIPQDSHATDGGAGSACFTVLGAAGFIGSHLVEYLEHCGHVVRAPGRKEVETWSRGRIPRGLGHVVYCIGRTADFRHRLLDTMEASFAPLIALLRDGHFDSLLYLSSTRLYGIGGETGENTPITVTPAEADHLYNIAKLAGETLCLTSPNPAVRVARLSNVYGAGMPEETFLAAVIRCALTAERVTLQSAMDSAKDYIAVEDVVRALRLISLAGRHRLYNVAFGRNTTNREIAEALEQATGCRIAAAPRAPVVRRSPIRVDRLMGEFGARMGRPPAALPTRLDSLVNRFREDLEAA